MKSFYRALLLVLGIVVATASGQQPDNAPVILEIRAVLRAQQEAWNRGDIDSFMNGYARNETTVFVSGDEVRRGWQTVHDGYLSKYTDRAKMGTLTFSDLEIEQLGPDSALALGRWKLKRASDNPHGRFTLIFRKTPDGWRIVHDHTSAAN
jgi:uncharacterized protein (TIGR02246 family)